MNRFTASVLTLAAAQALALPALADNTNTAQPPAASAPAAQTPAKPELQATSKAAGTDKPADGKKADVAVTAKGKLDPDAIRHRREAGTIAAKEQQANNGAVSPGPDGSTRFVVAKPRPAPQNPG